MAVIAIAGITAATEGGCSALLKPASPSAGNGDSPATRRAGSAGYGAGRRSSGKSDSRAGCPDLSDPASFSPADLSADFVLSADEAKRLRNALSAAAGVLALSAKLDTEVRTACDGIARELGGKRDFDAAESSCAAAVRAINDARGRLGSGARFNVAYVAPQCALPAVAIVGCLRRCDHVEPAASDLPVSPPRLDCPAAASAGACDGKCAGSCDVAEGMVCDGHCRGGCDWGFHGTCDGTCVGHCNGTASHGICTGNCVGQCNGVVKQGICRGRCQGPCELRRPAACAGSCSGRCSGGWKTLQCENIPKGATADAACGSRCDTDLSAAAQCSLARVTVTIDHARDAARAKQLATALQRYLPAILRVSVGMKTRAIAAARSALVALQSSEDLISGAGARGGRGGALSTCASGALRGGLTAIGSVNVSVRIAVEVKAATDATDNTGGNHRG